LLKNAVEAIAIQLERKGGESDVGVVEVSLEVIGGRVFITVKDNGCGLPKENRDKLTEPYVTTRAKGTGLGLAIVKKSMEEHGGQLVLEDGGAAQRGARVSLRFPVLRRGDEGATVHDINEGKRAAT
jgi:two-component system nitrogen regulation sensor histidine kinase NtrY